MRETKFVRLIWVLGIAAAAVLWRLYPPAPNWSLSTILTLAVLAITAEAMAFLLPRGATGSISFIPYLTTVLLVPNFAALVAISGARLIVEVAMRKRLIKTLFNVAQLTLSYSLAICIYNLLGGASLLALKHLTVAQVTVVVGMPMLVAYVATFAVNTLLVSHVIALSTNEKTWQVWRENNTATIGLDILASPLVFAFAWVYTSYGPLIASLLWLPILGLRQLSTTNLELAQTNR